jgi:hypothetical protein
MVLSTCGAKGKTWEKTKQTPLNKNLNLDNATIAFETQKKK